MEDISYFLKIYFVATFQLYKPLVPAFLTQNTSQTKTVYDLFRRLCSRALCSRATTSGFSFCGSINKQQILANSSILVQEFVKQRRRQVPSTQRRLPNSPVCTLFLPYPSSQAVVQDSQQKMVAIMCDIQNGKKQNKPTDPKDCH